MRTPTLHLRGDISSADPGHFVFSGCGAVGSEDCRWQSARESTLQNLFLKGVATGSRNVTAPLNREEIVSVSGCGAVGSAHRWGW